MKRLIAKLGYLADLTPRETWRLAKGKLPFLPGHKGWTPDDLLNSAKHRHGIRFAELLLRQEAVAQRHMDWAPLDFEGQRVVEVGCGPLGGYGPLAIFRGAEQFESAEPEWEPGLFFSDSVRERYFRVMHADLVALYGARMDFDAFWRALREKMTVHKAGFDAAPIAGEADIVLSQSCLEHVFPLEGTVAKLADLQGRSTRFLHLVDFGNHYLGHSPFDGLYEQPPEVYIARRGKAINLARSSDVARLFEAKGIPAHVIPSRVVKDSYRGSIHSWWRERYDESDLFTQLALVAGPAV